MNPETLPPHEREVYDYLATLGPDDNPPTLSELERRFGRSRSAIQNRLRKLRDKGFVTWQYRQFRTLRAIRPGRVWVAVPEVLLPTVEQLIKEAS